MAANSTAALSMMHVVKMQLMVILQRMVLLWSNPLLKMMLKKQVMM